MAIIEVNGLTRKFSDRIAVDGLTFQVNQGEVLGFLGPNGAGKTTTIRMLAGIIAPTSGGATVAGLRIPGDAEKLHESIGMLTETPGFYDRLSAGFNLTYFAGFYNGFDAQAQSEKYLKSMGLWERRDSRVGTFSKGMKQRLALARALLHEPKVLFLDEPTAGLDPEAAREVRDLIKRLSAEGRTVFVSTHNLAEAEELCHRIAIIRTSLLAIDTGQNLRDRFFRRQVIVRVQNMTPAIQEAARRLTFVKQMQVAGNELTIEMSEPEQNRPELVQAVVNEGGRVLDVFENKQPLEDIYLKLVHEENGNEP
ncbi:MAG TPA: ABC transporter ATP-binding protein [Dehalococcoidales bacterium]|nr:ABC transporter ATP-binding protein [Dehalococcoidales bacterium]